MAARTKARKRALDVLFEADQRGANLQQVLNERRAHSGAQTPLPDYADQIVAGVIARWPELNDIIRGALTDWSLERVPAVDRALLRMAAWEILCNPDVPTSVAIDEAVSLATDLSTDDSASFINGVLGTIARDAPALGGIAAQGDDATTGGGIAAQGDDATESPSAADPTTAVE